MSALLRVLFGIACLLMMTQLLRAQTVHAASAPVITAVDGASISFAAAPAIPLVGKLENAEAWRTMRDHDVGGQRPVAVHDAASPRYMAPVPGVPGGGVTPGLNDFSGATSTSSALALPLSQDLPPQAYLGPRATGIKVATTPDAVSAQ